METKKGKISILLALIVTFAFLGIVNSAILLDIHNNNLLGKQSTFCKAETGCDNFDNTSFSKVWGVPIFGIMLGFYMIFLVVILLKKYWPSFYKTKLVIFSILGIVFSVVIYYIMQFVLKEYCNYCTYSIIINLFIAIFSFIYCKKEIKKVTN